MANIYLQNPHLTEHDTLVTGARPFGARGYAVSVAENIVRPAGGGQPADYGQILLDGWAATIDGVEKLGGETWLLAGSLAEAPIVGSPVALRVDRPRRDQLSRAHTLTHLLMAAIRTRMPGYESKGADIAEHGRALALRFRANRAPRVDDRLFIERLARTWIGKDLPVRVERVKSLADAEASFPEWRIDPDLSLTSKIRVIYIPDVDANPCSGSHMPTTAAVGAFALGVQDIGPDGVITLSAGIRRQTR